MRVMMQILLKIVVGQQNAKPLKQQLKRAKEPFRETHQLRGCLPALPDVSFGYNRAPTHDPHDLSALACVCVCVCRGMRWPLRCQSSGTPGTALVSRAPGRWQKEVLGSLGRGLPPHPLVGILGGGVSVYVLRAASPKDSGPCLSCPRRRDRKGHLGQVPRERPPEIHPEASMQLTEMVPETPNAKTVLR